MNNRNNDPVECEWLILGAGLAGLAAASVLGHGATVLEAAERPGGLVRTDCFDGYWFDRVIHLLYCPDEATERRVLDLMGDLLAPCPPEAWVETIEGTTRFPFQMHLGGLPRDTIIRCLADLARATYGPRPIHEPDNFAAAMESAFGKAMCEVFMYPYNRKMWRRPLAELAPGGFTWNIARPEFDAVARGALTRDSEYRAYNSRGYFPRPPADAPWRGMELLSRRLAAESRDLRLEHRVTSIDLTRRIVTARHRGRLIRFRYRRGCASTLPLPQTLTMCADLDPDLAAGCRRLKHNRVESVALKVRGPRPRGRGHWRYYADENIIFNRLIYMCEFDPLMAPVDGWGMLAEVTQRGEDPRLPAAEMIARVVADARRVGAIPDDCRLLGAHHWVLDPAYVAFFPETIDFVTAACGFLRDREVEPLGRYGRWEYSSMGQVMRDGFAWGDAQSRRDFAADAVAVENSLQFAN